jgi:hypothetical protein
MSDKDKLKQLLFNKGLRMKAGISDDKLKHLLRTYYQNTYGEPTVKDDTQAISDLFNQSSTETYLGITP